jgi:hypothetical protein
MAFSSNTTPGMRTSVQPIRIVFGEYRLESGSRDGYIVRFQKAMLRAVVPNLWAIVLSESPALTTYVMNVGIGVGVGRTNEGLGVGPVGPGEGAGEAARGPPAEPAGPPVGGRQPPTAAAMKRTMAGPARRSIIG